MLVFVKTPLGIEGRCGVYWPTVMGCPVYAPALLAAGTGVYWLSLAGARLGQTPHGWGKYLRYVTLSIAIVYKT
eukprot:SAG31_NODE_149_length_22476_cov_41.827189_6_plen_74_part_00